MVQRDGAELEPNLANRVAPPLDPTVDLVGCAGSEC